MLGALLLAKRPTVQNIHVVSLVPGGAISDRLRAAGIPVSDLGCRNGSPAVRPLLTLARMIRAQAPDVIQSWMYHADLMSTLALLLSGRRRRTRSFWGIRCSDMDVRHYRWTLRLVLWLNARLSHIPDGMIANSYAGWTFHQRLGYRARRFEVIPNGVDVAAFHPNAAARQTVREELGIEQRAPLVAMIARVDPMKDHACFLDALSRLPAVRALLVGKGTEALPEIPGLVRLGIRSDVAHLLAACDVVVSSSAFGEGFPNAVAEGMACGLPAVVTDVGDAARILGDTGVVVPPRDPAALAAAIRTILDELPAQRTARGLRARERIASLYSLDRAVAAFDALHASGE